MVLAWLQSETTAENSLQIEAIEEALANPSSLDPDRADNDEVEKFGDLLPASRRRVYLMLKNNPDLMSLRSDLALFELLQREIISSMNIGECKELWLRLQDFASEARVAFRAGDQDRYSAAINEIFRLISSGVSASFARDEYVQISRTKAQMVKLQSDLDLRSQETLPVGTFEALISEWRDAVREVCGEDKLAEATRLYRQRRLEKTWRGDG
jgi:hypothetical protein